MGYCTPADLYAYGLPRGSLPNTGRLVSDVDVSAGALVLDVHGFEADDPVSFRPESGGSMPGGLTAGTTYYAQPLDGNRFQVSATEGGEPLTLTTSGSYVLVIAPLPIAKTIEWASSMIDDVLPAHVVPLAAPYPVLVVATCAELAIGKLLARTGSASKSITQMVDEARKVLARWAQGVPVRGANAPPAANLAVSSASAPRRDSSGWNRHGGI